ncbi:hypothetical protein OTU49_016618 [Cherax quadricarinatus]|uniref:Uncharacterized protein n=1 Tax=Cherax quadricarinatus TaxID=27406 RepID=A0AAW0Y7R6_CHEQU|nr:uncharacterized protein LOC128694894 isoform X1 [Cherax quadricarinatus]
MPRYAYQKPRNRLYSYDCYKPPLTLYFDKESSTKEKPGDQSFVERLKTFPLDGSIYYERASSAPPLSTAYDDIYYEILPPKSAESPEATARGPLRKLKTVHHSHHLRIANEVKPPGYQPIWMKHPYRLPVEDIVVPPHESSIWPENIPHFSLVSSYDLMIDFLGIRKPCTFC